VQAQALYRKLPYDPDKDFTYISAFNPGHLPFAVHKDVPARSFKEFVELARKSPTNLGTFAPGSSPHMIAGQLNKLYGTKIEAVHFRGEAPMWQEVATGRVQAGVGSVLGVLPHVQSGAVRVLAVPTLARSPRFPDVPTYVEQGFDAPIFKLRGWIGFLGPASLPAGIVERLGKLVLEAADTPRVQKLHETFAIPDKPTTPAEFSRLYREEGPIWIGIARELGITLD
jgi:tripartite-type tricarboxylate transporter receptor subunit TctC